MIEHVEIDCSSGMAHVSDEPGPDQQSAMAAAVASLGVREAQNRQAYERRLALARLRVRVAAFAADDMLNTQDLADLLLVMGVA